jgi:hypothetical protein
MQKSEHVKLREEKVVQAAESGSMAEHTSGRESGPRSREFQDGKRSSQGARLCDEKRNGERWTDKDPGELQTITEPAWAMERGGKREGKGAVGVWPSERSR